MLDLTPFALHREGSARLHRTLVPFWSHPARFPERFTPQTLKKQAPLLFPGQCHDQSRHVPQGRRRYL